MLSPWDITMEDTYAGLEPVDELGYGTMGKAYYKAQKGYFNASRNGRTNDALRYGRIASRAHHGIMRKAANHGHVRMASDAGRYAMGLSGAGKSALAAGAMAIGGMAWKAATNRYAGHGANNTRNDVPDVEPNQPRADNRQQGRDDYSAYANYY